MCKLTHDGDWDFERRILSFSGGCWALNIALELEKHKKSTFTYK